MEAGGCVPELHANTMEAGGCVPELLANALEAGGCVPELLANTMEAGGRLSEVRQFSVTIQCISADSTNKQERMTSFTSAETNPFTGS